MKEKFNTVKGLKGSTHQHLQIEMIKKSSSLNPTLYLMPKRNSTTLRGLGIKTPTFID
jgi:hypothetical protein